MILYTLQQIRILNRMLVFFICFFFCSLLYINTSNIKSRMTQIFAPFVYSNNTISSTNVQEINNQFSNIINTTPDVNTILLYKFVTGTENFIYNGRIGITSKSRDGSNFIDKFNAYWIPMNVNANKLQILLLNNVHYENVNSISQACIAIPKESENCSELNFIKGNFKAVISLPIMDSSDYTVKGYITFLLERELSQDEQNKFTKEMTPYLHKIALLATNKES